MSRHYRQQCAVARALDVLGERWTLLILRDLCAGSAGFNQLLRSLAGIGPNLLSARLGLLQEQGLVSATDHGYALSARGQAMRPLLRSLMASGHFLGLQDAEDDAPLPARTVLAMSFDPLAARGLERVVEVRVGDEQFTGFVRDGCLEIRDGAAPVTPDVRLEASPAAFHRVVAGESPDGDFRVRGGADALRDFRRLFAVPLAALYETERLYSQDR